MKKNFLKIAAIALTAMLVITGCSNDNGANVSTKTVRVIGTYGKLDTPATKALSRAAETENMGITSVDKVVVNGKDIKNDLKPVGNPKEGDNNVEFEAQVEISSKVNFTASAKPGYVFDEWKVDKKTEKPLRKEIKKWLDQNDREESETLTDLPSNYIPHLLAEYDNGFYITLDPEAKADANNNGTRDLPYTADEFAEAMKNYKEDELTLVVSGSDAANFAKVFAALASTTKIDEIKIKADNVKLSELPKFSGLKEIAISGFTFDKAITVSDIKELSLENCKFTDLTVTNVEELEIEGGEAANIIIKDAVKEVELEKINITGEINLMEMTSGEVEIEGILKDLVKYNPENKDLEVEFDD